MKMVQKIMLKFPHFMSEIIKIKIKTNKNNTKEVVYACQLHNKFVFTLHFLINFSVQQ